jgi:undecaprenyl-diphosphatase
MPLWIVIVILGLVEGLTEFIPVSSTGHLIIANELLGFEKQLGSAELASVFSVVIQLGAIFAIGILYREKLIRAFWSPVAYALAMLNRRKKGNHPASESGLDREPLLSGDRMLFLNLMIATIPAALIGFFVDDLIDQYLFNSVTVALALIVGGFIIFFIEARAPRPTATSTASMTPKQALVVGLAQVLSLFPGTSRSGATIMGGLCAKMSRPVAAEFSFLLSFPIMCMASAYKLLKDADLITPDYLIVLGIGCVVAFASAYVVVRWLIRFVQTHSFRPFAWYRIALGIVILALHFSGFFVNLRGTTEAERGRPDIHGHGPGG